MQVATVAADVGRYEVLGPGWEKLALIIPLRCIRNAW
jgi:hypothetical protein